MSNFSMSLHLWHGDQKPASAFDLGGGCVGVKLPVGGAELTLFARDKTHADLIVAALNYQITRAKTSEAA